MSNSSASSHHSAGLIPFSSHRRRRRRREHHGEDRHGQPLGLRKRHYGPTSLQQSFDRQASTEIQDAFQSPALSHPKHSRTQHGCWKIPAHGSGKVDCTKDFQFESFYFQLLPINLCPVCVLTLIPSLPRSIYITVDVFFLHLFQPT